VKHFHTNDRGASSTASKLPPEFATDRANFARSSSEPDGMAVRKCSKYCQLFCAFRGRALFVRGMKHPYFSVGPSRQKEALVWLPERAGSSGIPWRIHSLAKKTLHRHRAGFEPQRASPFMKRVKASLTLGEAVRA
jgi:hypothetical protein